MWKYIAFAAACAVLPSIALAQSEPVLIKKARIGTFREVEGARLAIATVRADCPAAWRPSGGGPCFDALEGKLTDQPVRVLEPAHAPEPGERITADFSLFSVKLDGGVLRVQKLDLPVSDVTVPRECGSVAGQGVSYLIAAEDGARVAYERQIVVCGGGPRAQAAPVPEGEVLRPGKDGVHHRTEERMQLGEVRYLATPGTECDIIYRLRETWCAQPAITHMMNTPALSTLEVLAARVPVTAGSRLSERQFERWELRRSRGSGFRANLRPYRGSLSKPMPVETGCRSAPVGWHVVHRNDGLYIADGAHLVCGAPAEPVAADVYEVYGETIPMVYCASPEDLKTVGSECYKRLRTFAPANDKSGVTVMIVRSGLATGSRLWAGSSDYDFAWVGWNPDGSPGISLTIRPSMDVARPAGFEKCHDAAGFEGSGYIIGPHRATLYRWFACDPA